MSRHALFVSLSLVLSLCPTAALQAGPITYNLNNYQSLENGWTLTGFVTTDGTIGAISAEDITAWAFIIGNGATFYNASSTQTGAALGMTGVDATSTQLLLPASTPTDFTYFNLVASSPANTYFQYFRGYDGSANPNDEYNATSIGTDLWFDSPSVPSLGSGDWVIATAPATAPEPASITLMLAGIGGLAGYLLARSRRAAAA